MSGSAAHPFASNGKTLKENALIIREWFETLGDENLTIEDMDWSITDKCNYPLFILAMTPLEVWQWFGERMEIPI